MDNSYHRTDEVGLLMHDFRCSNPDDMLFPELAESARIIKSTEKGRDKMSKVLEEIYKEGMVEGMEKGVSQANEAAVKKLMVSLGLKEEEARRIIYS